jgi:hypothetical protein
MIKYLFAIIFTLITHNWLFAQTTLFDNSRVSSVYIVIPADSLEIIMTDVLSDYYYHAMFIYDSGTSRDTLQNIGFRLRGNSSRYSKKKSFKISFSEYSSGRKYQGVKKINLNGQHNDPTMIREKLYYDSWTKAGMAERRTSFVKLYINQIYYGLYTNLEEMDKDWLQRVFSEKSGNLYKCTYPADLVFHGTDQQVYKNIQSGSVTGGRAYDLQTNESEDNYSDLVELITILNMPADTSFARLIALHINVDSFLKAFAIDVATGNWDDYMYNKNNYYLYHRSDINKFEFVAYDTDNTFGVDWLNKDWATRNCLDWYIHSEPRPLASKILAVPEFKNKYRYYLDTIAREIIEAGQIFPHIDSLQNLIANAAIADTFRRLDYGYTVSDFFNGFTQKIDIHTPYGIKPFIEKRYRTINEQLAATSVSEKSFDNADLQIFPNPVSEKLIVKTTPVMYDRKCYIYDVFGRECFSSIISKQQNQYEISVGSLNPGIHLFVLINNGVTQSKRFLKN